MAPFDISTPPTPPGRVAPRRRPRPAVRAPLAVAAAAAAFLLVPAPGSGPVPGGSPALAQGKSDSAPGRDRGSRGDSGNRGDGDSRGGNGDRGGDGGGDRGGSDSRGNGDGARGGGSGGNGPPDWSNAGGRSAGPGPDGVGEPRGRALGRQRYNDAATAGTAAAGGDGPRGRGFSRSLGEVAAELDDAETQALIESGWEPETEAEAGFRNHGERVSTFVAIARALRDLGYDVSPRDGAMQGTFGTPHENGLTELQRRIEEAEASGDAEEAERLRQELEAAAAAAKPGAGPDDAWTVVDLNVDGSEDGLVTPEDLAWLRAGNAPYPTDPASGEDGESPDAGPAEPGSGEDETPDPTLLPEDGESAS